MQQDISYTPYNQPHEIEENGFKLKYYYGPDEQRRFSELYDNQDNLIKKIYYNGNYEVIETNGNTYEVNYLFAPEGLFGIAVKENNNPVQVYYTETDHLGSIVGLYNQTGQPVYTQSFDAWGRNRNPETWEYTTNTGTKPEWLIRGYTGHEHLPEQLSPFGGAGGGLINMNGRMYDPVLGRMLSPDNFVQDPSRTQSYNRYSYVFNNPLKYTDPSGEIAWMPIIVAAVVFGYGGGAMASGNHNPFTSQYWTDGWEGFMLGAAMGATSGGRGYWCSCRTKIYSRFGCTIRWSKHHL
jgi:RHS repeat-associated protein